MEDWEIQNSKPIDQKAFTTSRVLASTSGNIQNFMTSTKREIEPKSTHLPASTPTTTANEHKYPIPTLTLASNDHQAVIQRKLAARRVRYESNPRRKLLRQQAHLRHPKYLAYRSRTRKDIGKDGDPIWPDHVEESFQTALLMIPPMGRKKKSQHGKPQGRNELISEWIFQDTGVHRDRKKISSHIQVLSGFLKEVPEWEMLIKPSNDQEGQDELDNLYYTNSIAEMVSQRRNLCAQQRLEGLSSTNPTHRSSGRHVVWDINFGMWVSLPQELPIQMTDVLHTYTRLQSGHCAAPPTPLETMKGWRNMFPHLLPIVEDWSANEECDLIFFNSSFELMSDFPPKGSKLGISLELNFLQSNNDNYEFLRTIVSWSSKVHIYQHGRHVQTSEYDNLTTPRVGLVKPLLESNWWAQELTNLTIKKRGAQDKNDEAAMAAADEYSKNFMRGLTVMQEVFARCPAQSNTHYPHIDQPVPNPKRMAILMWRFSQAPKGHVGTTSWQQLIAPPDRITTNSPPVSESESTLPPLIMDSIIENSQYKFNDENAFDDQSPHINTSYPDQSYDTHFNQDEFMCDTYSHQDTHTIPGSYTYDSSHNMYSQSGFHTMQNFELHSQPPDIHGFPEMGSTFNIQGHDGMNNIFEHLSHTAIAQDSQPGSAQVYDHDNSTFNNDDEMKRQPLVSFDMNTHKELQAQLIESEDLRQNIDQTVRLAEQENVNNRPGTATEFQKLEAVHGSSASASAMYSSTLTPARVHGRRDSIFATPKTIRPPLQVHHSFAGVLHTDTEPLLDTPARQDFALLIASIEANAGDDIFGGNSLLSDHVTGLTRPQSQPLPFHSGIDQIERIHHSGHEELGDSFVDVKLDGPVHSRRQV